MGTKNMVNSVQYIYDFAVDGGAQGAIDLSAKNGRLTLPVGAVVKSVYAKVLTACTSGGAATVEYGPTADADGYSGAAIAVASLTANAVFNGWDNGAALLWDDTNDHPIYFSADAANQLDMLLTIGTADLTAGKIAIVVEYYLVAEDL